MFKRLPWNSPTEENKPKLKGPSALVCVCVCVRPCTVAKQTAALAPRTTCCVKGLLSSPFSSHYIFLSLWLVSHLHVFFSPTFLFLLPPPTPGDQLTAARRSLRTFPPTLSTEITQLQTEGETGVGVLSYQLLRFNLSICLSFSISKSASTPGLSWRNLFGGLTEVWVAPGGARCSLPVPRREHSASGAPVTVKPRHVYIGPRRFPPFFPCFVSHT